MEAEKEELGFIKIHHCFMAIGSAFGGKRVTLMELFHRTLLGLTRLDSSCF